MAKKSVTTKHKDLGIFYTDPTIADFVYSIINIWKNDEDKKSKRWQSHIDNNGTSAPHYPSVIDPAVGEGVFLKEALEQGFTDIHHIFGLDLDVDAVEKWKQIHLLKAFGGNEKDLEAHFFNQNGLDKIKWHQHAYKYYKHLKKEDIKKQQFNLVIGNPPYGGTGLDIETETEEFIDYLREYEILPDEIKKELGDKSLTQTGLFTEDKITLGNTEKASKRLKSFPIEILFIERFLKLAKPDGWVAIVLPEGIFANSNSYHVREYITEQAKVEAIVSLPRDAFKNVGTTAKTSILFLRKYGKTIKKSTDYPILLANTSNISRESFSFITEQYKEYYGGTMSKLITTTKDDNGREIIMVRTDKKISDLMNEKPFSRWDVGYWLNIYDEIIPANIKANPLKLYIEDIQGGGGGSHFSAYLGDKWDATGKFAKYLHISSIMDTGLNWNDSKFINKQTYDRLKTKQIKKGDILLSNKGTVGKTVVISKEYPLTVVGDTRIIRTKNINPYYVCIFLKSKYGQAYSARNKSGVASEGITVDQMLEFKIPLIADEFQDYIEKTYLISATMHEQAMVEKLKGNTKLSNTLISKAENNLNQLITHFEEHIRKIANHEL